MASSMSFEQWMRRPVYLAQCRTFALARNVTPLWSRLRWVKRTPAVVEARNAVAAAARALRAEGKALPFPSEEGLAVRVDIESELKEFAAA